MSNNSGSDDDIQAFLFSFIMNFLVILKKNEKNKINIR